MKLYKIIIVDDEQEARTAIKKSTVSGFGSILFS